MFSNHIAKPFFLLFTVVLVSTTIVVRETITSVSGLSPTISHTYLTSSSPQNNIPNNLEQNLVDQYLHPSSRIIIVFPTLQVRLEYPQSIVDSLNNCSSLIIIKH